VRFDAQDFPLRDARYYMSAENSAETIAQLVLKV
jgi:hypothetical protein